MRRDTLVDCSISVCTCGCSHKAQSNERERRQVDDPSEKTYAEFFLVVHVLQSRNFTLLVPRKRKRKTLTT